MELYGVKEDREDGVSHSRNFWAEGPRKLTASQYGSLEQEIT